MKGLGQKEGFRGEGEGEKRGSEGRVRAKRGIL
jgi:hypothetical protein